MRLIRKAYRNFRAYIYDSTVPLKERSFMVFSVTVLVALFAAIPCGLIMREPPLATVSTFVGAVFFAAYVYITYRRKTIHRAKIAISFILVFVFLPAMFFTNGGVYGGTPVWLLLGTIYIAMILEGSLKYFMLITHVIVMGFCWCVGYYYPQFITEYTREGNYIDAIAGLIIVSGILYFLISFQNSLNRKEEAQKNLQRLFEQTATALVNAIDAKDKYTHGHSSRVAEYSRKIAVKAGMTPSECDTVYYMALLHDVGKIGIPESIINKEGKLTDEEYEVIKQHPTLGQQILQGISEFPYLAVGAHYHHERYDGKGYPHCLKGTDIPEYARIISVADAYDAMTSKRSYRDPIPQQQVREELVKGIGTQFDPDYARIMVHLLDMDIEYDMQEKEDLRNLASTNELICGEYKSEVSEGILINPCPVTISMKINPEKSAARRPAKPVLLLFDALDARFHSDRMEIKDMLYFEYGLIRLDGSTETNGARLMRTETTRAVGYSLAADEYMIKALRIQDHALVRIVGREKTHEVIIALPDSSRFLYIGLTGEHCVYSEIKIDRSDKEFPEDAIPRIAEKISYIDGPVGDVPNVQIDGYRTASTPGIPIVDGMRLTFHGRSLPTARLVWHCPFITVFTSDDGTVTGSNYHDYTLMRLDGECWEGDPDCDINLLVNKNDNFNGWDDWKDYLHKGFDVTVQFERKDNLITVRTENNGISIRNTSIIRGDVKDIYVALTGDQCALTNIRVTIPQGE